MSRYQYYEFLAVDRPLDERQRAELGEISGSAEITATGFIDEDTSGEFRADPHVMVERYFDAFLSHASWGTRRLMVRLPRGLLDPAVAEQYCYTESASVWATDDQVILTLTSYEDPDRDEGGKRLGPIVPVRSELASGDLRLLYLAWLLAVQADEVGDDELEPPVPPNLRSPSGPLRAAADFLRIDEDLLAFAAAASPRVRHDRMTRAELVSWIGALPAAEKDRLLVRAAGGEGAQVQAILQRRFAAERAAGFLEAGRRTAGDLWANVAAEHDEESVPAPW